MSKKEAAFDDEKKGAVETPAPWWGDESGALDDADMRGDPVAGAGAGIRFWMPTGSERTIIFLTDGAGEFAPPPPIWEHNFRMNGRWTNWATCLTHLGIDCPLCELSEDSDNSMGKRYRALLFSIIDTHEFQDRAGNTRKNTKKLLVAKKDTYEVLRRKYKTRRDADPPESLRGAMFKVYRSNKTTSASVGEDFEFQKMVDLDSLPDTEPFDCLSMFAPDAERVKRIVAKLSSASSVDEGTDTSVEY